MKTKRTVVEEVVSKARRHARAGGDSPSRLIGSAPRDLTQRESPSFSRRWRGRLRVAERKDGLYRALARKYL